jgi:adenylate cyclase class 2
MKASRNNNREIEVKLPLRDLEDGRRRLREAGFRIAKRRIFEENTIFDTPKLKLRKGQCVARVRTAGRHATFTYKGPPEPSRHKQREELEIGISNAETMSAILERLDLRPVFRYQKYRTELRRTAGGGVATLDETPIGTYLELEGSPAWIDRTARQMGYSEAQYITLSYAELYLAWCKDTGAKRGDMVF